MYWNESTPQSRGPLGQEAPRRDGSTSRDRFDRLPTDARRDAVRARAAALHRLGSRTAGKAWVRALSEDWAAHEGRRPLVT